MQCSCGIHIIEPPLYQIKLWDVTVPGEIFNFLTKPFPYSVQTSSAISTSSINRWATSSEISMFFWKHQINFKIQTERDIQNKQGTRVGITNLNILIKIPFQSFRVTDAFNFTGAVSLFIIPSNTIILQQGIFHEMRRYSGITPAMFSINTNTSICIDNQVEWLVEPTIITTSVKKTLRPPIEFAGVILESQNRCICIIFLTGS